MWEWIVYTINNKKLFAITFEKLSLRVYLNIHFKEESL